MSLLIKGMDMPKEPWDCPCHNGENGQCQVINIGCYDYIPNCCPLVEVPTPHGRLIDANAFFEDICNDINAMTKIGIAVDGDWLWGKLNDALGHAPTVIEAEVKHERNHTTDERSHCPRMAEQSGILGISLPRVQQGRSVEKDNGSQRTKEIQDQR